MPLGTASGLTRGLSIRGIGHGLSLHPAVKAPPAPSAGFIVTFSDPDGDEYIATFTDPDGNEYILVGGL